VGTKSARKRARLRELDPGNPDCLRAFLALLNFERQFVARAELVELHIHEFVGVKEDILLLSFDLDESEALLGENGYDASLHVGANWCT